MRHSDDLQTVIALQKVRGGGVHPWAVQAVFRDRSAIHPRKASFPTQPQPQRSAGLEQWRCCPPQEIPVAYISHTPPLALAPAHVPCWSVALRVTRPHFFSHGDGRHP